MANKNGPKGPFFLCRFRELFGTVLPAIREEYGNAEDSRVSFYIVRRSIFMVL